MPRLAHRLARLAVLCAVAAFPCGCQQEMLKATPFAGGEHPETIGSPEGRVNLWPLLYHRKPATSFLWPLGEVTDTTWAVRPLVASYGSKLDILWPLAHLDLERGTGYVLPSFFWGEDWFFLFPLYGQRLPDAGTEGWVFTPLYVHSFAPNRNDNVIPPLLTWWSHACERTSLQVALGLYGRSRDSDASAEHLFPLYWRGINEAAPGGPRSHFVLFPLFLGFERTEDGVSRKLRIIPALLAGWGDDWMFCPLYGQGRGAAGDSGWIYSPLYVHRFTRSERHTLLLPILSWWRSDAQGRELHLALSLYGRTRSAGESAEHLFPFYWRGVDARSAEGARSHLVVFPFYLGFERVEDGVERKLRIVPPLLGGWGDHSMLFLLYGRGASPGGDAGWLYTPLYFHRFAGSERLSILPPLFTWWRSDAEGSDVRVALGLYGRSRRPGLASEHLFPFYWRGRSESEDDGARSYVVLFPFYGRSRREKSGESWTFTPLYVERATPVDSLAVVPPLLSWWRSGVDGRELHLALGLYGRTRRAGESSEHLFPFYWRGVDEREPERPRSHFVLFPFYLGFDGRHESGTDRRLRILPWLLGGWWEERAEVWAKSFAVFPLFYIGHETRNPVTGEAREQSRIFPPLLSAWHRRDDGSQDWHVLLSLIARGGSPDRSFSRVLPLYYDWRNAEDRYFGLPALLYFSHWSRESHSQVFFPFAGYTRRGSDVTVNFLFPFGEVQRTADVDSESFFPLFAREHRKRERRWERPAVGEGPHESRLVEVDERSFHILYLLYDSIDRPTKEGERYRRSRVLWRLWHDEEVGDARSLDVFPFITYDRQGEESLTWSWLYKLIRYERKGEAKALNLFFLPAIRWGGG